MRLREWFDRSKIKSTEQQDERSEDEELKLRKRGERYHSFSATAMDCPFEKDPAVRSSPWALTNPTLLRLQLPNIKPNTSMRLRRNWSMLITFDIIASLQNFSILTYYIAISPRAYLNPFSQARPDFPNRNHHLLPQSTTPHNHGLPGIITLATTLQCRYLLHDG